MTTSTGESEQGVIPTDSESAPFEGNSSARPLARYEIHLIAKPNVTIAAARLHVREQTLVLFDGQDRLIAVFAMRNIVGLTVHGDAHGHVILPDELRSVAASGCERMSAARGENQPDNPHARIDVYVDGSFREEQGLGAWAFVIPALQLKASGCELGVNIQEFEFRAVLEGLRALQGSSAA